MESRIVLKFEMEFDLSISNCLSLRIKTDRRWIGMTLVYVKLITNGNGIMIYPTKRYKFIFNISLRFMSRFGKPLGCLIFFWVGDGLERWVGVWPIDQYKGGAGEIFRKFKVLENFQCEIFRKFKVLENFQYFWKFSLEGIN